MTNIFKRAAPLLAVLLCLAVALPVLGCASSGKLPAGYSSQFDYNADIALTDAHAVLVQAGVEFGSDPTKKDSLNKAFASYNAANHSYKAYHDAAAAGGIPDTATVQADLDALAADVGVIKALLGKGKKSGSFVGDPVTSTARNGTQPVAAKGGAA